MSSILLLWRNLLFPSPPPPPFSNNCSNCETWQTRYTVKSKRTQRGDDICYRFSSFFEIIMIGWKNKYDLWQNPWNFWKSCVNEFCFVFSLFLLLLLPPSYFVEWQLNTLYIYPRRREEGGIKFICSLTDLDVCVIVLYYKVPRIYTTAALV